MLQERSAHFFPVRLAVSVTAEISQLTPAVHRVKQVFDQLGFLDVSLRRERHRFQFGISLTVILFWLYGQQLKAMLKTVRQDRVAT